MPNLIIIDTLDQMNDLKLKIDEQEYVAFDTETTGITLHDMIIGISVCFNADEAYYIVIHRFDTETKQLVPTACWTRIKEWVTCLAGKKLVAHNSVFDCSMIEHNYGVKLIEHMHTDTLILAHLLNENRRVGLKELGKEYFGDDATKEQEEMKASVIANGGKWLASDKEMWKCDSQIMAKYGAQDALLTWKLFNELVPELYDQSLDTFFYDEESMPLLRGPTYQMNTSGLKVDQEAMTRLKNQLKAECAEAKAFIYSEIDQHIKEKYPGTNKKNTFNIGASKQIAWLLFEKLGLEFGTLTDSGKQVCKHLDLRLPYVFSAKKVFIHECKLAVGQTYLSSSIFSGGRKRPSKIKEPWNYMKTDKKTLTKLAPRYKWIEKLLEYQRKTKLLSTYVEGIEERVQYGIIRPSFLQHGTTSGRYSSRNPNFQNLPRDDKRIKACIVSRPGRCFVGADYSQLEPRVFAYFSNDERLLKAFDGSSDFYSVIGMEVYDKTDCTPHKEGSSEAFGVKYKKLRDLSKVIALASTYGATAHQLAPTTGKSIEATQEDIDNYFERFPGVKSMMLKSHELAKKHGRVKNLFGRPRRMPEAKKIKKIYGDTEHGELPYEIRNILNLAVNHRIQSTGASIVNRAAVAFLDHCAIAGIDCKLVLQVHDSLVVECDEKDAEDVSLLLEDAMCNTVDLKTIKLEAVPKIGKSLAEV